MVCLIFYNTKPADGLNQFFDSIDQNDLPVMLTAMAVHEASHCIEQREAYVRGISTKYCCQFQTRQCDRRAICRW